MLIGFLTEHNDSLTRLKTVIERFANSTSTDDLFDAIKKFYRNADRDPRLRDWFRNVDTFTRYTASSLGLTEKFLKENMLT